MLCSKNVFLSHFHSWMSFMKYTKVTLEQPSEHSNRVSKTQRLMSGGWTTTTHSWLNGWIWYWKRKIAHKFYTMSTVQSILLFQWAMCISDHLIILQSIKPKNEILMFPALFSFNALIRLSKSWVASCWSRDLIKASCWIVCFVDFFRSRVEPQLSKIIMTVNTLDIEKLSRKYEHFRGWIVKVILFDRNVLMDSKHKKQW